MKRFIVAFIVIFGLLAALAAGLYSIYRPKQIIPNRAAVQGGPAAIALDPGTSTITTGTATTINFVATLPQGTSIDGFQVVATVSGTIPNDINWQAATPSGMTTILDSATGSTAGLTIKFAYVTPISGPAYTTASTILGKITFTAPATGITTIAFDNNLTKIVEHGTSNDLAGFPQTATYTYQSATTSPSGSPSPTPGPTATPGPTNPPTSCTRGNQSITLSPSTQSAYAGQALTYTVNVTNNDDKSCDKANFSLSAILPYSNWIASFAQPVLSLSPQTSGSTTMTITASVNSPIGTLPVGVTAVGPKAAVVAAANFVILAPTPTPKPTPEVIFVPGTTPRPSTSPSATASALPFATITPTTTEQQPGGILSQIPTAVIYAIGAFLLIVLFFILRALFGGNKGENNPPKLTPPAEVPPMSMPPTPPVQPYNPPTISHSVEPPISQPLQ